MRRLFVENPDDNYEDSPGIFISGEVASEGEEGGTGSGGAALEEAVVSGADMPSPSRMATRSHAQGGREARDLLEAQATAHRATPTSPMASTYPLTAAINAGLESLLRNPLTHPLPAVA